MDGVRAAETENTLVAERLGQETHQYREEAEQVDGEKISSSSIEEQKGKFLEMTLDSMYEDPKYGDRLRMLYPLCNKYATDYINDAVHANYDDNIPLVLFHEEHVLLTRLTTFCQEHSADGPYPDQPSFSVSKELGEDMSAVYTNLIRRLTIQLLENERHNLVRDEAGIEEIPTIHGLGITNSQEARRLLNDLLTGKSDEMISELDDAEREELARVKDKIQQAASSVEAGEKIAFSFSDLSPKLQRSIEALARSQKARSLLSKHLKGELNLSPYLNTSERDELARLEENIKHAASTTERRQTISFKFSDLSPKLQRSIKVISDLTYSHGQIPLSQ